MNADAAVARKALEQVCARGDLELAQECYAANFIDHVNALDLHGHEGIRRWWQNLLAAFPDLTVEVVEVRNFGEATLGILRNRGRGGGSDTPFEQSLWLVAWWRRGKCIRWDTRQTAAEALEAAGLRE